MRPATPSAAIPVRSPRPPMFTALTASFDAGRESESADAVLPAISDAAAIVHGSSRPRPSDEAKMERNRKEAETGKAGMA